MRGIACCFCLSSSHAARPPSAATGPPAPCACLPCELGRARARACRARVCRRARARPCPGTRRALQARGASLRRGTPCSAASWRGPPGRHGRWRAAPSRAAAQPAEVSATRQLQSRHERASERTSQVKSQRGGERGIRPAGRSIHQSVTRNGELGRASRRLGGRTASRASSAPRRAHTMPDWLTARIAWPTSRLAARARRGARLGGAP